MAAITQTSPSFNDVMLLKLAREIAMDIRPLDDVLVTHEVTSDEWAEIQSHPVFRTYLRSAIEEWNSATNTAERVRLKSLAFVEESLPEFYARAHDQQENLQHKIRVLEVVAKFAGVGGPMEGAVSGEKFTVTINLGADHQLKIEKDVTPQGNLIEGHAE